MVKLEPQIIEGKTSIRKIMDHAVKSTIPQGHRSHIGPSKAQVFNLLTKIGVKLIIVTYIVCVYMCVCVSGVSV